ncbi:uncharacterized protein LOC121404145 [Drosophila obscura]|uniref:uncharacterized protein LOC121404145 n=1 Tax=Drosophila obscura TaxID=7282 RepID=UPI001BB1CA9F|nr:uncharacterized protein LOC121404145 [Drosophila obscura]
MSAPAAYKDEPRYVVIKRLDNNTFVEVSPFVIKEAIDRCCEGEVDMCRKTRGGFLLVRTKNVGQAHQLMAVNAIHGIPVCVSEHRTLNFSKGVIFCKGLSHIGVGVILRELMSQNVVRVRKLPKKRKLRSTGLVVLTFASATLPSTLSIGYDLVTVTPFIPLPLQCRNCLRLGHPTASCRGPTACRRCSAIQHTAPGDVCTADKFCVNCLYGSSEQYMHSPVDKSCPEFVKQQEVTAIKVIEKVDYETALRIYISRMEARD